MKKLNDILVNTLIFFFVVTLLEGAVRLNTSSGLLDRILVGLIYGITVAFGRNIIKFFKLPVTNVLIFVATFGLSLLFSLVCAYVLRLLVFTDASINLGLSSIQPIEFADPTISLLVFSIITSVLTFILVSRE